MSIGQPTSRRPFPFVGGVLRVAAAVTRSDPISFIYSSYRFAKVSVVSGRLSRLHHFLRLLRLSSLTYAKVSSRLKQVPRDYRMLRSGKILPGLWLLYFAKRSKAHGLLKEFYRMLPELAPE